jgi:DNA replication protein DnaC
MDHINGILNGEKETLTQGQDTTRRNSSRIKPPVPECAICSDTGWKPSPAEGRVMKCDCRVERETQWRYRELDANWPEYRNAKLETYKSRNVGQQNAIRVVREKPAGSYFFGGYYQRGKTHLLVAQYRWMLDRKMRCILVSSQDLIKDLQRAEMQVDGEPPYRSPILHMVESADSGHLFIDDIEKAPARTGFRAETLFAVLDRIKRRQLGLSVTSNLPLFYKKKNADDEDKEDLRDKLTDQVAARIHQICRIIEV